MKTQIKNCGACRVNQTVSNGLCTLCLSVEKHRFEAVELPARLVLFRILIGVALIAVLCGILLPKLVRLAK